MGRGKKSKQEKSRRKEKEEESDSEQEEEESEVSDDQDDDEDEESFTDDEDDEESEESGDEQQNNRLDADTAAIRQLWDRPQTARLEKSRKEAEARERARRARNGNAAKGGIEARDEEEEEEEEESAKKPLWLKVLQLVFSQIGMIFMCLGFCAIGGVIFEHLEATNEETYCKSGKFKYQQLLNATVTLSRSISKLAEFDRLSVDLLWDTMNQNDLSDGEKMDEFVLKLGTFRGSVLNGTFNGDLHLDCALIEKSWSFMGSLLFSVTVVSTIGYGHISPKTYWGRLVLIAYAMLGIPITLMMLANVGELLADTFRQEEEITDVESIKQGGAKDQEKGLVRDGNLTQMDGDSSADESDEMEDEVQNELSKVQVPITITLSVMAGWLLFGAATFTVAEYPDWSLLESSYFCFITVSTIGFGDYVPGIANLQNKFTRIKLCVTGMYMIVGMAMLSMTFQLMQDEVVDKIAWAGEITGLVKPPEDSSSDEQADNGDNDGF